MGAERDRGGVQPVAGGRGQAGRGGFLQDLLVPALQGAVAFAEGDDAAPAVPEDLHLDMTRLGHVALEEHAGVAEAGAGGALHAREALAQLPRLGAKLHADAAAELVGRVDGEARRRGQRIGEERQAERQRRQHDPRPALRPQVDQANRRSLTRGVGRPTACRRPPWPSGRP